MLGFLSVSTFLSLGAGGAKRVQNVIEENWFTLPNQNGHRWQLFQRSCASRLPKSALLLWQPQTQSVGAHSFATPKLRWIPPPNSDELRWIPPKARRGERPMGWTRRHCARPSASSPMHSNPSGKDPPGAFTRESPPLRITPPIMFPVTPKIAASISRPVPLVFYFLSFPSSFPPSLIMCIWDACVP